jgi:hypothetical protein
MTTAELDTFMKALPPEYEASNRFRVRAVHGVNKGLLGALINTTCRWCKLAGRGHTSNEVYFLVSHNGHIDQMCHAEQCRGLRVRVGCVRPQAKARKPARALVCSRPGAGAAAIARACLSACEPRS